MTDDIRDLLGRYATGSLTAEERKRLFDASLDDQELFEELAREDEMKELLAGPGVRDRLIRALEPPKRRISWVWALAPLAVMSAALFVILTRPVPKPQQVAVATVSAPPAAPTESTVGQSQPVAAPAPAPVKAKPIAPDAPDAARPADAKTADAATETAVKKDEQKEAAPKAMDQVAAAAPPATPPPAVVEVQAQTSQVQVSALGQQNAPGGPKQNAVQSARSFAPAGRAAGKIATLAAPGFGFHYSVETAGHLIFIPSADGYLAVKSGDGAALFASRRIATGVVIDVVLPASVRSVSILFSAAASPAPVTPAVRTASEGDVQAPVGGPSAVAIEVTITP
jgi:hypothetical protein